MDSKQAHQLRLEINVIKNTLDSFNITVQHHFVQDFQLRRGSVPHPLVRDARRRLEFAVMWLGKYIAYHDAEKKTDWSLGPDDATDNTLEVTGDGLVFIRESIQGIIETLVGVENKDIGTREKATCRTQAFTYLTEARMVLGELKGELFRSGEQEEEKQEETIQEEPKTESESNEQAVQESN